MSLSLSSTVEQKEDLPSDLVPAEAFQSAGLVTPRPLDPGALLGHLRKDHAEAQAVMRETVEEYDKNVPADSPSYQAGRAAAQFYSVYTIGGDFHGEGILQNAELYAQAALTQGSTDPLVVSIRDQALYKGAYSSSFEALGDHLARARLVTDSNYHPLAKTAAVRSVVEDLRLTREHNIVTAKESRPLITETAALAGSQIAQLARHDSAPVVREQAVLMVQAGGTDEELLDALVPAVEKSLVEANLDPVQIAIFQGRSLVERAAAARGTGWASKIPEDKWEKVNAYLGEARGILTRAAQKHPDEPLLPATMIAVERAQGGSYRDMQQWFDQATALDPNNFTAHEERMSYLDPLWYGETDLIWNIGERSANTQRYDAKIPLTFIEGLRKLGEVDPRIFRNKLVWDKVQAVYEAYLAKFPDSVKYRTEYLGFAAKAGRWQTARKQYEILGDHWDRSILTPVEYAKIEAQLATQKKR